MGRAKTIFTLFLAVFLVFGVPLSFAALDGTEEKVLGADRWSVESDGDFIPIADSTYDIGESGAEVDNIYADSVWIGGTEFTSFAAGTDGNWTDDGTTTTLNQAPTKFIATHATGDWKVTQVTTDDVVGTTNAQTVDLSTNNKVIFGDSSDTFTVEFDATDTILQSSDGAIVLKSSQADGEVHFKTENDTDDYLAVQTNSNVPTITTIGSCNLEILSSSGEITFGDDNLTTTGTVDAGLTTATSFVVGDDTIDVVVDDQMRFASNDEESTIEAYGFEAKDGVLQLTADEGDDAGDKIQLVSDQATNSLFVTSDTGVKDTHATIFTLAKTGAITTTGDIVAVNDSASTNVVQDIVTLTSSSTGTVAAGLGAGLTFNVEDLGGIEQQGSIDVALTTATNGAEDADMIFSVNTAGAIAEVVRIVAASSGTVGDSLTITSNTTETNAVTDILSLANVTGTAAANTGLGITWDFEDASGAEEQASLDVVLIDETNATEDADFIFSQQSAGAVTETLRIVGTQSATASSNLQFTGTTSETNGIVDIMILKLDSSGTPAANLGAGISVQIDDETPGVEEQASIDFQVTDATTTAENCDIITSVNTIGTVREVSRIDTDCTATAGTVHELTSWTIETNGVIDMLELTLDNTSDTATDNFGAGISILMEDEDNAAEQQASIDFVLTDAGSGAEDCDVVFSQNIAGTITETVRLDADASLGGAVVIEGASPLALGGTTDDAYFTILAVADAASSSKTVTLPSITSSIALETVATTAITANTTATITVVPGTDTLYTYTIDTDNENCTLTFSAGGTAGDIATLIFITDPSGSADEVMTIDGTLSDSAGTLTLANGVSKRYVWVFISDGTIWNEISRTAVLG